MPLPSGTITIAPTDPRFEGVSEDVASLAAPLMQKHNVTRENAVKLMEQERKNEQKEMIIRKNIGRLQKQMEEQFN